MYDMNDDDRKDVLSETLMDELKTIREYVGVLPTRTDGASRLTMDERMVVHPDQLELFRNDRLEFAVH